MLIKRIFTGIAFVVLLSSSAFGQKLVIGMAEAFKPYNYIEEQRWAGIDVEIMNEVFKRLGVEVEYREFPWARALKMAEGGKIDGILSVYCDDKRPFLDNTFEPSYPVKISFFGLKENNFNFSGADDFSGKRVGVNLGNYYAEQLAQFKGVEQFESVDIEMLVRQLKWKRIDFALHEAGPFLYYAKELGHDGDFEAVHDLQEDLVCMAFSKPALGAESKVWAEKTSKVIAELKQEGFIQRVMDTYLGK